MIHDINQTLALQIMLHRSICLILEALAPLDYKSPDLSSIHRDCGLCFNVMGINKNHADPNSMSLFTAEALELPKQLGILFHVAERNNWGGIRDTAHPFGEIHLKDNYALNSLEGQARFAFLVTARRFLQVENPVVARWLSMSHMLAESTAELAKSSGLVKLYRETLPNGLLGYVTEDDLLWDPINSKEQADLIAKEWLTPESGPDQYSNGSGIYAVNYAWGDELSRTITKAYACYQYSQRVNRINAITSGFSLPTRSE